MNYLLLSNDGNIIYLLNYVAIQVDAFRQHIGSPSDSNHFGDLDGDDYSSDDGSLDMNHLNKVTVELKLKIFLMLNFEMEKEEAIQIGDLDKKYLAAQRLELMDP